MNLRSEETVHSDPIHRTQNSIRADAPKPHWGSQGSCNVFDPLNSTSSHATIDIVGSLGQNRIRLRCTAAWTRKSGACSKKPYFPANPNSTEIKVCYVPGKGSGKQRLVGLEGLSGFLRKAAEKSSGVTLELLPVVARRHPDHSGLSNPKTRRHPEHGFVTNPQDATPPRRDVT